MSDVRQRLERVPRPTNSASSSMPPAGWDTRKRGRRYLGNPSKIRGRKSVKAACLQIWTTLFVVIGYFYLLNRPRTNCNPSNADCPDAFYSASYDEARHKFLEYASAIHELNVYHLPITDVASHPFYPNASRQTLYTDVAVINGNAAHSDHLIIHISGIHGTGAFAGSAIQCAILHKLAHNSNDAAARNLVTRNLRLGNDKKWANSNAASEEGDDSDEAADMDMNGFPVIMLVHAFNPYGMFYGVAGNEHNVDLNTRHRTSADTCDEEDASSPSVEAQEDQVHHFLNPRYGIQSMVELTTAYIPMVQFFKLDWVIHYVWTYAIDWYVRTQCAAYYFFRFALPSYDHESEQDAVFERFAMEQSADASTQQSQASHAKFRDFLRDRFEEHNWYSQFSKITVIDVHTGSGKFGKSVTAVYDEQQLEYARQIGRARHSHIVRSVPFNSDRFLRGMYANVHTMSVFEYMRFISDELMMQSDKNVDKFAVYEHFGTYSREYVLNAVRFAHAYRTEYLQYLKQMNINDSRQKDVAVLLQFMNDYASSILKEAFDVQDIEWKTNVIVRGVNTFADLFDR